MQMMTPVSPFGTYDRVAVSRQSGEGVGCQRLNRELAQRYRALTLPAYRHLLNLEPQPCAPTEGDRRLVYPVAIGAMRKRSPIGLALGTLPLKEADHPRLVSLYVTPRERRSGVASALLRALEEAVRERSFDRLSTVYRSEMPWAASFEALLHKLDWSPPRPHEILTRFRLSEAMESNWFRKFQPQIPGRYSWIPPGRHSENHLTFFPWKKVRARDLEMLYASQLEKRWIPDDQLPWQFERRDIEPASSLGIRLGTEIVGWVINHALDERSIRMTHLFIRRDLARQDLLSPALVESLRRAHEASFSRAHLNVGWRDHELALFAKRFLAPWCGQVAESRESIKSLKPMPQPLML